MTQLYTVILEYRGGTYIAQVSAASAAAALPKWLSKITDDELAEWKITRDELDSILKTDKPVPISGCREVWCITGLAKHGLALINIVATEVSSPKRRARRSA